MLSCDLCEYMIKFNHKNINKQKNKAKILKHEFIRGKITKEQYEILKENIADVIKDLVSKKN